MTGQYLCIRSFFLQHGHLYSRKECNENTVTKMKSNVIFINLVELTIKN